MREFLGEVGQECQALFKEDTSFKSDEMATLIVEIEATLNYRPLTYVYDDVLRVLTNL